MDRKRKLDVFEQDASKRFQSVNGSAHGGIGSTMPGQAALNPYTGRPYSGRYYEILAKRKGQNSSCIARETSKAISTDA